MERSNDQRHRNRNRGRQDNERRDNPREGGQREAQRQRGGDHHRGESGRGGDQGRSDRPKVDRSAFSHYSREEKYPTPPQPPKRDYDPDPVTGKPIENIFTAMTHRDSERPVSFDTVIEQLRNAENLSERQQLIYVGSGQFGIYEEVEEGGKKRLVLQRKITYEDSHHKPDWRRELAPGISRDYRPTPEPLDRLYTVEEQSAFPKIGAQSGAYMPKNQ
jgi:hypothetical protein